MSRPSWSALAAKIGRPDLENTGSLYLCLTGFLPLGLPETHPFWSTPDEPWTGQKIYAGENLPADKSIYAAKLHF